MSSSSGQQWNGTNPTRLLDTRYGATANPRRTLVGPWQTVAVRVAGVAGSPVPAGASGAMLNLTVTHPTGTGYLSVDRTRTSALNFTTDRTVANLGLAALPVGGTVLITNRSPGSVQIIADVQGYTASTGRTWMPVAPVRLADMRSGTPANPVLAPLRRGASITVRVAGAVGSPVPSSATSASLNVTVVGPRSSGYLGNGSASVVNFTDSTVANLTISPAARRERHPDEPVPRLGRRGRRRAGVRRLSVTGYDRENQTSIGYRLTQVPDHDQADLVAG